MNSRAEYGADDPRQHTRKIKEMLHGSMQHIREDITKVMTPRPRRYSRLLPKYSAD